MAPRYDLAVIGEAHLLVTERAPLGEVVVVVHQAVLVDVGGRRRSGRRHETPQV